MLGVLTSPYYYLPMRIPWFTRQSKLYVGLDMGSSFFRMVVEQLYSDGESRILGAVEIPSAGMRQGEISDASMVGQCLRDLCRQCEREAKVEIATVYLSVTGAHFAGENNQASYRLPEEEYLVNAQHIAMAREKARGYVVADDRFIVNDWCGRVFIDKRETTRFPIGLAGRTLDLNCHVISGQSEHLQRSLHILRQLPVQVDDLVFAPFATAQYVLSEQQKEAGAILIDIGGGTSDYICYEKGDVVASGCLAMGGLNINQAILGETSLSSGRKISMKAIEYLKCHEGDAFGDMNDLSLASYCDDLGLHPLNIERGLLNRTINKCMSDMLGRIQVRLQRLGVLRAGMHVYLTGGGSLMRGVDSLAGQIFDLPVHQPQISREEEDVKFKNTACFSTAIGLLRYAQMQEKGLL